MFVVFLKDSAYEYLLDFKRARVSLQLQTWWRCANPSKQYRRAKRVTILIQKTQRRLIFTKKFAAMAVYVIKIQACWRRVKAGKIVAGKRARKALLVAKRAEQERIRIEEERIFAEREEENRLRAAEREDAVNVVARCVRGRNARIELAKRKNRRDNLLMYLNQSACKVQTRYRVHQCRVVWVEKLSAARVIIAFVQKVNVKTRSLRQYNSIVAFQSCVRAFLGRHRFRKKKRSCIKMQSQCRTHRERGMFLGKKGAATKFQKFYRSFERNQVSVCCLFFFFSIQAMSHIFLFPPTTQLMFNWIEEVFTMVEVGDDGFVEDLLEFHEDVEEYAPIRDVRKCAANLRHAPSYASLLHSAAKTETASPVLVELCVEAGAVLDEVIKSRGRTMYWCTRDVNGNTPLHIVATLGDRYLSIAAELLEISNNKIRFLNQENEQGATALDVAIENALSASSTSSDKFTNLVKWMFRCGGSSMLYGTKAEVDLLLADVNAGQRRMQEMAAARETRRAHFEREKLKNTTAYKLAEIRSNEGARMKKAEEDKIVAAELAIKEAEDQIQRDREEKLAAELAHAVSVCLCFLFWPPLLLLLLTVFFFVFFTSGLFVLH